MNDGEGRLLAYVVVVYLLLIVLYPLPALIAFRRSHPNRWLILAVNVMLGASVIGWAVALIWALDAGYRGADGRGSRLHFFAPEPTRPGTSERGNAEASRPAADAERVDATAEIERLARLRDEGHLTEEEFAALKAGIVRRV